MSERISKKLFVHPVFRVLLNRDCSLEIALWFFTLILHHLAALCFDHAFFEFLVSLHNVVSLVYRSSNRTILNVLIHLRLSINVSIL